jgi:hypothetical protein
MVADFRHAVVSCKYKARLFIVVEVGEKFFSSLDDVIDDLDIFHVFLQQSKSIKAH